MKYLVVFKKTASQEVIDQQAEQVDINGGLVGRKFSSSMLRGFSAEIPETYLLTLQNNLRGDDSPIAYIEPDSVVTIQDI